MATWYYLRAFQYLGEGRWSHQDKELYGEQYAATDQLSAFVGQGSQPVYTWRWNGSAWVDVSASIGLPYLPEVALGYDRSLSKITPPLNPVPPPPPGTSSSWGTAGRVLLAAAGVVALVWGARRRAREKGMKREKRFPRRGA